MFCPPPSAEDVGKVPTVQEDGSYALTAAGGSNAPLILEFATTSPSLTVDTPLSEIKAAIEAGRQVWFTDGNGDNLTLTVFRFDGATVAILVFGEHKIWYENGGWDAR